MNDYEFQVHITELIEKEDIEQLEKEIGGDKELLNKETFKGSWMNIAAGLGKEKVIRYKLFQKLKDMYEGEYSYVYKVTCKCNNNKFMVYKDSHPTVIVECCACKRRIIVYNLSFYPSATKLSKGE